MFFGCIKPKHCIQQEVYFLLSLLVTVCVSTQGKSHKFSDYLINVFDIVLSYRANRPPSPQDTHIHYILVEVIKMEKKPPKKQYIVLQHNLSSYGFKIQILAQPKTVKCEITKC